MTDTTLTWDKRLARARRARKFTEEDQILASQWSSCQVGELRQEGYHIQGRRSISGGVYFEPDDAVLARLGYAFNGAVAHHHFLKATALAQQIRRMVEHDCPRVTTPRTP